MPDWWATWFVCRVNFTFNRSLWYRLLIETSCCVDFDRLQERPDCSLESREMQRPSHFQRPIFWSATGGGKHQLAFWWNKIHQCTWWWQPHKVVSWGKLRNTQGCYPSGTIPLQSYHQSGVEWFFCVLQWWDATCKLWWQALCVANSRCQLGWRGWQHPPSCIWLYVTCCGLFHCESQWSRYV